MDNKFLFEFVNEDTDTSITRAFTFKPLDFSAAELFNSHNTEKLLGNYADLEDKYGVHDGAYDPGFTTYEVPEDQQAELMEAWRKRFLDQGFEVGPVIALDEKPTDLIFAINDLPNFGVTVHVTPRFIWETEGCQWDQELSHTKVGEILTEQLGLEEMSESTFVDSQERDLEVVKTTLIEAGLEHHSGFQAFIDR